MKDGFIKVAAATPDIKVCDCPYNSGNIIKMINQANEQKIKLLVFPELCVSGYTCLDLFLQETLIKSSLDSLFDIVNSTKNLDMIVIVGLPLSKNHNLYNCAAVILNGDILGIIPKTFIPNYGEFCEARYFVKAPKDNSTISLKGKTYPFGNKLIFKCKEIQEFLLAVEVCEDLWSPNSPSISHALSGASIIANLSASNEVVGKSDYRKMLVSSSSAKLICGYVYSSAGNGESTTDLVFSGHNMIAENGSILKESTLFENSIISTEIDLQRIDFERRKINSFKSNDNSNYLTIPFSLNVEQTTLSRKINRHPFVPNNKETRENRCETILSIQSMGLKKRIEHTRAKSIILGVSGGLDSTLALLVSVRALEKLEQPNSDIIAVTMPCFGTTDRTYKNAVELAKALGTNLKEINIKNEVLSHFEDINHDPTCHDTTFENAQARIRTLILMDIANKYNGIVVGTGDLSELALGWATYNGDHMSMYSVNSSVPKTLIQTLVRHEMETTTNEKLRKTLGDILDTPISPELLPATDGQISQKTEDLVGPYELHDFFLYYAIRWGLETQKVLRLAKYAFDKDYNEETIKKWLQVFYKRFFSQQFKRSCMPDGPKVGSITLSPRGDFRMPSDAAPTIWTE